MVDRVVPPPFLDHSLLHRDEGDPKLWQGISVTFSTFPIATVHCFQVVYFTSMFPYLVLTIFFIRGITLNGASAGLAHMYTPKVEKLLDPKVWLEAATQVFYSFGLAFGSLIAFGSYNTPKNNCVRDVILVSICNALTAIYASVVIFAILGFKAVSNVAKCTDE
jgi:solute carrier family 6 amino acid/orphan transporter-like 15/16/17/18/20